MDALRWECAKLMFVVLPLEVIRSIGFLLASTVLAFFFWLLVPFVVLFPDARLGAAQFAKRQVERAKDEAKRREAKKRQFEEWRSRWKQAREKMMA